MKVLKNKWIMFISFLTKSFNKKFPGTCLSQEKFQSKSYQFFAIAYDSFVGRYILKFSSQKVMLSWVAEAFVAAIHFQSFV